MLNVNIYDHLDDIIDSERFSRIPLRHLASELMEEFWYNDENDLQNSLTQAFEVCCALNIPINLHFKKVYLYFDNSLKSDWLLSDLGSYLLLINGNTRNPNVARARLYLISLQSQH